MLSARRWTSSMAAAAVRRSVAAVAGFGDDEDDEATIGRLERGGLSFPEAIGLLEQYKIRPRAAVLAWFIRRCGDEAYLDLGRRVHAHIVAIGYDHNRFLCNLLVEMYGKCGSVDQARRQFDSTPQRNVYSWTIFISALAQNGHLRDALDSLRRMDLDGVHANHVTYVELLLAAAASPSLLVQGRLLHQRIEAEGLASHPVVGNSLMSLYARSRRVSEAKMVFDKLQDRNVVSWTTLSSAYAQAGHFETALSIFKVMTLEGIEPTLVTIVTVADVCAGLASLSTSKSFHAAVAGSALEYERFVVNAFIDMYGKCAAVDEARLVFDSAKQRDLVTWNSIIGVYAQNGRGLQALDMYKRLKETTSLVPDTITFTNALEACCCSSQSQTYVSRGKEIHADLVARDMLGDPVVACALINMYGKCSNLVVARQVFDSMVNKCLVAWNTIVMVYAQNGQREEALELFMEMNLLGVGPGDEFTFVAVLFACSHGGLVEDSCSYFASMVSDYGVLPTREHCGCMLDLLGRAGWLEEAEDLVNNMPFHPDHIVWSTLVGACVTHVDLDRGLRAAEKVMECLRSSSTITSWLSFKPTYTSSPLTLHHRRSGPYIAMSNLYALAGRWDDVSKMRKLLGESGIPKRAGSSSIEVQGKVHEFVAGDTYHPMRKEIYAKLTELHARLKDEGYIPDTAGVVVQEASTEAKEDMLTLHSERLAIAFGLISTPPGLPLCIIKNLRVCRDCHSATKLISKIVGRKIVVRDANRFHAFDCGKCTCNDYW